MSSAAPPASLPPLTPQEAERWLSSARLTRYLTPAGGSLPVALKLYEWNALTAAVALTETAHLEVAMRNAYDRVLCSAYPDWLDEASALWSRYNGTVVQRAQQAKANDDTLAALDVAWRPFESRTGQRPSSTTGGVRDKVIANTTFGVWSHLTDSEREKTIWTPALRKAFPPRQARGVVHRLALDVNTFRNRLAHHEPLFTRTTAFASRIRQVRLLHALLDPASADWCYERSQTSSVVGRCPIKGLIQWNPALDQPPSSLLTTP